MIGMVVVQFLLGVFTLLTQVQIFLGVAHQFGALLLLAVMLIALHRTGRGITASAA
jgi:cytochrome c oxidase assembly protein subunit 15